MKSWLGRRIEMRKHDVYDWRCVFWSKKRELKFAHRCQECRQYGY